MKSQILLAFAILAISAPLARAYGPDGHHLIGAIADARLANTPAGKKISIMLDGMTLREAAQVPDTIKGWDKKGVEDPKNAGYYSSRPRIGAELREFWKANQPNHDSNSSMPSHHWFHYTDVPLEAAKYSSGKVGRSEWDIVRMISYCVAVLRGELPEDNPRKITKAVAIILLAHYVGDIHQPLHVGAQYFDQSGRKVNPDLGGPSLEDQGGNSIMLEVSGGTSNKPLKLHSFWDSEPVKALFPAGMPELKKDERKTQMGAAEKDLVHTFISQEPKGWRLPASVPLKDYAETWADEIVPIAREAHERLEFQGMTAQTQEDGPTIAAGRAREKPMPDHLSYRVWATNIVRVELPKAGWRLADLLEKAVSAGTTPSAAVPPSATATPPVPTATASVAAVIPPALAATPPTRTANASPYGAYPTNYKEIVTSWLRTAVPGGAKTTIEWQTEPKPADLPDAMGRKLYGYLVIFSTGSASGPQTRAALIHEGHVVKANGF